MMLQIKKETFRRIIRFGLVGVFNTVFDLVILNMLISLFGIEDPFMFSVYKGVSFTCALVSSYFLNKYFTFSQTKKSRKVFLVFVFFSLIGFVVNVVLSSFVYYILTFYSGILSIHVIATVSAAIGAIFGALFNYINYSYFVFK